MLNKFCEDPVSARGAICTLSVVIPLFNEEKVLRAFHRRLVALLGAIKEDWELIYVDDGSTDAMALILKGLQTVEPAIGVVRLSSRCTVLAERSDCRAMARMLKFCCLRLAMVMRSSGWRC